MKWSFVKVLIDSPFALYTQTMNFYNYNHLFYFYVTAKLKGVTTAAQHLNTSQSSLSTQLKILEHALGKKLFRKTGRRLELTEVGKELFSYCRRAFDIFDEMFDQLNAKKSSMGVRITIGVADDIERPFVADALSKIAKSYPKVKRPLLNLISMQPANLLQLLKVGEIDLLLSTHTGIDNELDILSEFKLPVGAFISADLIKTAKKQSLDHYVRTEGIPFSLPSRLTSLRSEIDNYFILQKLPLSCVFESNIISSVIRVSLDAAGATILPQAYVSRELSSGKLIALNQRPLWFHRLSLLSARQPLEQEKKDFANRLMAYLREII